MISSNTIYLQELVKTDPSRRRAARIRDDILRLLEKHAIVEIDMRDVHFTPSVADEVIAKLALRLGAKDFKRKIKIIHASDSQRLLMKHVIARRMAELGTQSQS